MVNVFGGGIASGPEGNLQVVKKVVTDMGQFKDYIDEIRKAMSLDLYLTDYTRDQMVHLLPPFLFIGVGICIGRCYHDAGYHSTDCNGWK